MRLACAGVQELQVPHLGDDAIAGVSYGTDLAPAITMFKGPAHPINMLSVSDEGGVAARSRVSRLSLALSFMLVACASASERGCHRDDDTPHVTTSASAGPTTGSGTAGDIDDAELAALDRAVDGALDQVYGGAMRRAWKREDGPGSVVFTLEYTLTRAHTRASAADLQASMAGRGFAVDRVLDDATVTSVFAARDGFPVIVTVDVGATLCVVTAERAGP